MATRTSTTSVTFSYPFRIGLAGDPLPAGTYDVDTDEEAYEAVGHTAYLRTATLLQVTRGGVTETHSIDPDDLARALADDARRTPEPALPSAPKAAIPWYRRMFTAH